MSTDNPRLDAGRAVLARWLGDEVRALTAATREVVEPQLQPGERVRAELPDGTVIGAVTIGKPAESAVVTDERALLAWVRKNRPTELIEQVNPAYLDQLKRQAKANGDFPVTADGEVIPGIEVRTGSASYRPTVDAAQVPLLRRRLAELVSGGLLELPGTDREAS